MPMLLAVLVAGPLKAEQVTSEENPDVFFAPVYGRLGITLPARIARDTSVWSHLDELRREPCDQVVIVPLAKALYNVGFRREAAESAYRFAKACGGPDNALDMSANIFFQLSDYGKAVEVTDVLVGKIQTSPKVYYLRARALDETGDHKRALDDYAKVIEFSPSKKNVPSEVFFRMASAYAAVGRFCEAMKTIETWVAFDPDTRDIPPAQRDLAGYAEKGHCAQTKPMERFPLLGQANVVRVTAMINGEKGVFILDTGASFVSVQSDFAERAKLRTEGARKVRLNTANGPTTGLLSKADSIKLGNLNATNIPVVVQSGDKKVFGMTVDGLLGMSFLSRFDVHISKGFMEVSARESAPPSRLDQAGKANVESTRAFRLAPIIAH